MATSKRASGMTKDPLASRGTRRTLGLVTAEPTAPLGVGTQNAKVSGLAPNPDNPASRTEKAEETLLASVRSLKAVLQPLSVMTPAVFLKEHPQHTAAIGNADWVIIAGHQRRAAAIEVGLDEVPIYVVDDLVEQTDLLMIAENVARTALAPMDEAAHYRMVMERHGLSQRQLAQHTGVSQSHISKRLQLLVLPEQVQTRVNAGDVQIQDALEVADRLQKSDDDVRAVFEEIVAHPDQRQHSNGVLGLMRNAESAGGRRRKLRLAQEAAEAEGGVKVIENADSRFGRWSDQELKTKKDIAAARKEGTLVVGPAYEYSSDDKPRYFTTKKPKKEKQANPWVEKERLYNANLKESTERRLEFLSAVVSKKALPTLTEDLRLGVILHGVGVDHPAGELAREWCASAKIGPTDESDYDWRDAVAAGHKDRARVAAVLAVAAYEVRVSRTSIHSRWSQAHVDYLEWLQQQGYQLNDWETEKLGEARTDLAEQKQAREKAKADAAADAEPIDTKEA